MDIVWLHRRLVYVILAYFRSFHSVVHFQGLLPSPLEEVAQQLLPQPQPLLLLLPGGLMQGNRHPLSSPGRRQHLSQARHLLLLLQSLLDLLKMVGVVLLSRTWSSQIKFIVSRSCSTCMLLSDEHFFWQVQNLGLSSFWLFLFSVASYCPCSVASPSQQSAVPQAATWNTAFYTFSTFFSPGVFFGLHKCSIPHQCILNSSHPWSSCMSYTSLCL